jgi:hypothetical protein
MGWVIQVCAQSQHPKFGLKFCLMIKHWGYHTNKLSNQRHNMVKWLQNTLKINVFFSPSESPFST